MMKFELPLIFCSMKGTLTNPESSKICCHDLTVMAENHLLTLERLARSLTSRYEAILRTSSGGKLENDILE